MSDTPSPLSYGALRRLYRTLFLRGRAARGLQGRRLPTSIGVKLRWLLLVYGIFGLMALAFPTDTILVYSASLHTISFFLLGTMIAASSGEILFNREEADILLHRPITARSVLWAKMLVLVEAALWLTGAFNLAGMLRAFWIPHAGLGFVAVHAMSLTLEAMFTAGFVVLVYELCLRYFGRDRLDGLLTGAQVLISTTAAVGIHLVTRSGPVAQLVAFDGLHPAIYLLPPVWFAALDEALVGKGGAHAWYLAGVGGVITACVLWLALGRLAAHYQRALQFLGDSGQTPGKRRRRGILDSLSRHPPLCWWLREPAARAAFILTGAYMLRDRETKLRLYPALIPSVVMCVVFMVPGHGEGDAGGDIHAVTLMASVLSFLPFIALGMLRYSNQWQATDLFRVAPIPGPGPLCHGARCAALLILMTPVLLLVALFAGFLAPHPTDMLQVVPGLMLAPLWAVIACRNGRAVPLSLPSEDARAAGRSIGVLPPLIITMIVSWLGMMATARGWFTYFVICEIVLVAAMYMIVRRGVDDARWESLEKG